MYDNRERDKDSTAKNKMGRRIVAVIHFSVALFITVVGAILFIGHIGPKEVSSVIYSIGLLYALSTILIYVLRWIRIQHHERILLGGP